MSKKQSSNGALAALVIAALVISAAGVFLTLSPGRLQQKSFAQGISITGHQSSNPNSTVQLTIQQVSSLRFVNITVNWGVGAINTTAGNTQCILDTEGTNDEARCANFTTLTKGFVIENDGTINVTVHLSSNKNRTQFIGGSDDLNAFRWKVSNNESGSCQNLTGPTSYADVNTSSPGTLACQVLSGGIGGLNFLDGNDTLRIDINITMDTTATTGQKTAIITATGTAV